MAKNLIWVKGVLLPPPDIDGYNATRGNQTPAEMPQEQPSEAYFAGNTR